MPIPLDFLTSVYPPPNSLLRYFCYPIHAMLLDPILPCVIFYINHTLVYSSDRMKCISMLKSESGSSDQKRNNAQRLRVN